MSDFNPYAAPESDMMSRSSNDPGEDIWRDGPDLLCTKGAWFPDRCLKCNAPCGDYRLKRTLRWHPSGYYILLLISPILYLIVAMFVWHRATLAFPLCEEHRRKRIRAILIAWLVPLAGIFVIPLGIRLAAGAGENKDFIEGGSLLLGIVMILGGLIYGLIGSRVATPKRIDARFVWLKKVSPAFLATLPLFNVSTREGLKPL